MVPTASESHRHGRAHTLGRMAILGASVNLSLTVIQIVIGIVAHSQALIADALHTLSDLIGDGVVYAAAQHSSRQADSNYPYGLGRIETIATSALAILLLLVAAGLAIGVTQRLLDPALLAQPQPAALAAALLTLIAKEALYRYTIRVARSSNSKVLEASAWHHRSDALSSLIVFIGIAGNLMGLRYGDALAALIMSAFIGRIGWRILWQSGSELVDAALEKETVREIEKAIRAVDGVVNLHLLRTRRSGGDAFADVHIQVPAMVSVSEGHQISEAVRRAIIAQVNAVRDVTVHTDPEDDLTARPSDKLPLRMELMRDLRARWKSLAPAGDLERVLLHYLDGQISIELYLPERYAIGHHDAISRMKEHAFKLPYVKDVQIYFTHKDALL